jgi:hypothetical protein
MSQHIVQSCGPAARVSRRWASLDRLLCRARCHDAPAALTGSPRPTHASLRPSRRATQSSPSSRSCLSTPAKSQTSVCRAMRWLCISIRATPRPVGRLPVPQNLGAGDAAVIGDDGRFNHAVLPATDTMHTQQGGLGEGVEEALGNRSTCPAPIGDHASGGILIYNSCGQHVEGSGGVPCIPTLPPRVAQLYAPPLGLGGLGRAPWPEESHRQHDLE